MNRRDFITHSIEAAATFMAPNLSEARERLRLPSTEFSSSSLRIARIVGVEYQREPGKIFLYATPAAARNETTLFSDDIVTMARASQYGDHSFSLEPSGNVMRWYYFSHLNPDGFPEEQRGKAAELKLAIERQLLRVFDSSTVQATLVFCDKILKRAASDSPGFPNGLRIGPSAFRLCAKELGEWVDSGRLLQAYPATAYATFYDFDVSGTYDGFSGIGIWFVNPKIFVRVSTRQPDSEPPKCARQFADNLGSSGIGEFMKHPDFSPHFLRLEAIFVLRKIFYWIRDFHIPIDDEALSAYRTQKVRSDVVRIREIPIVVPTSRSSGGFQKVIVRGGVRLSGKLAPFTSGEFSAFPQPPPRSVDQGPRHSEKQHRIGAAPGFVVTQQKMNQQNLLRIDISRILFGG